ncbi:hypothetical protein ACFFTM_01185 [Pseudoduganella plicata]|uniref:Uncharacterized protein n=1 Tax=Pseudoduganella plicata TaxID=321984 RepID=A0AA87Y4F9_9BURK|nr:hypothetical protein [Pseudoduganella plicata]GGY73818.1 hypothetical protein GCM10007388_02630 [Pseudoduganella plicata]
MLPIQPIGERSAVTQVYSAAGTTATSAPLPPGVAVDISPFGQVLGTLALAQRRLEELAASGADVNADVAQLGVAASELTEAFNLGRGLPLPGQAALPDRLTAALAAQQETLAQAGIAVAGDGRLAVDGGRLLAAFGSNRQATLATLTQAAARFAAAGETPAPAARQQAPAATQDETPPAAIPPLPPGPAMERDAAALAAPNAAAAAATEAAARGVGDVTEPAQRQQTMPAEVARADVRRQPTVQAEDARAAAQRLADLQVSASLAEASQATLTRDARQAAYRLEVAREVAGVQAAVQEDVATQDQRLAEVRAAALRQLTSSAEEDLAAQALADRLARRRDAAAAIALTPEEQDAQERLMSVRQAAAGIHSLPRQGSSRSTDAAIGIDSAPLASADDASRDRTQAAAAAGRPMPPNAADPALAAAIAAQWLAGGVPGGGGASVAPPPRTQLVSPVRPVARVTAAEGGGTKPRGGA